ncbi:MAG: ECF transporter S component [Coprothermobacterota bacterium]|nr:ECF transporter S component [Coprothermobacterota bacterium]
MNGKIAQTSPAEPVRTPGKDEAPTQFKRRITTRQITIAGICGAAGVVLAFTPLGLIPVPNLAGAATTLHIPAIVAGVFGGPIVGAFTGLILAISSWILYSGQFRSFACGGDMVAVADSDCFYQWRKCSCFNSMGVSSPLGYRDSRLLFGSSVLFIMGWTSLCCPGWYAYEHSGGSWNHLRFW